MEPNAAISARDVAIRSIFNSSEIDGLDLSGMDLSGLDFSGKKFTNVNFSNAKLVGTNFSNSTIDDCSIKEANFEGANFTSALLTNIKEAHDLNMIKVKFVGATLEKVALKNAIIIDADFENATLNKVSIEGTVYFNEEYTPDDKHILPEEDPPLNVSFKNAKLTETILNGWFRGCNYDGAEIISSALQSHHHESSFRRTTIKDIDINQVELVNSCFDDAHISLSSFSACLFTKSTFNNCTIDGVRMDSCSFQGADLSLADVVESDFSNSFYNSEPLNDIPATKFPLIFFDTPAMRNVSLAVDGKEDQGSLSGTSEFYKRHQEILSGNAEIESVLDAMVALGIDVFLPEYLGARDDLPSLLVSVDRAIEETRIPVDENLSDLLKRTQYSFKSDEVINLIIETVDALPLFERVKVQSNDEEKPNEETLGIDAEEDEEVSLSNAFQLLYSITKAGLDTTSIRDLAVLKESIDKGEIDGKEVAGQFCFIIREIAIRDKVEGINTAVKEALDNYPEAFLTAQKEYRRLARLFHPDINHDPRAHGIFQVVGSAYGLLNKFGLIEKKREFSEESLRTSDLVKEINREPLALPARIEVNNVAKI